MKLIDLLVHLLYYLAVPTKMVVCSSTSTLKASISGNGDKLYKKGQGMHAIKGKSNEEVRLLKKGKKCKDKGKKKKGNCIVTAAPSISFQPSTSMQPTMEPSVSSAPSSHPSSKPTSAPTNVPSLRPSLEPSINPTSLPSSTPSTPPTLMPSSHPSGTPTLVPSSHPTSEPTASPSSTPSLEPSVHPSMLPTLQPSTPPTSGPSSRPSMAPTSSPSLTPSAKPTMSQQPSAMPSISSQPSYNIMQSQEAIYNEIGEQLGIQSGCAPPENIENGEARYAEEVLIRGKVEFQYVIQMDESANVNEVLNAADVQFQKFVFDEYVECQGSSRRSKNRQRHLHLQRRVQDLGDGQFYEVDRVMGVSSLPTETVADGVACADVLIKVGQKCVVVDGGLTIFFEKRADINDTLQENNLLMFLKEKMKNGASIVRDDRIKGLVFIKGKNPEFDRGESIVGNLIRDTDLKPSPGGITYTGALLIGSAMLLVLGAIVAAFKRRRTKGYARRDSAVLEMLDREYDGDFDQELFEFEDFSPPKKKYNSGYGDASFPVGLKEIHCNGNNKYMQINAKNDDENEYSRHGQRYRRQSNKQDTQFFPVILTETSNGRYPDQVRDLHSLSSGADSAPRHNVKIISSGWDDEIEVDADISSDRISDKTLDFSTPTREYQQNQQQQSQSTSRKSNKTGGQSLFPLKMNETRNGRMFSVSRRARLTGGKNDPSKLKLYQDVHHCKSASCPQCQGKSTNKIKFISSYEGIEVDYERNSSGDNSSDKISDRTIDFSNPNMHERLYGNTNTIDL